MVLLVPEGEAETSVQTTTQQVLVKAERHRYISMRSSSMISIAGNRDLQCEIGRGVSTCMGHSHGEEPAFLTPTRLLKC